MHIGAKFVRLIGRGFQAVGAGLLDHTGLDGVWIDVGAHLGETTFRIAQQNRALKVYAFEPNWKLAAQRMGLLANYVVIPMAVAEKDGCADFYLNAADAASSLLSLDTEGLKHWVGREALQVNRKIRVPTIRLDTFLEFMQIAKVAFLKIDAQGADFAVVKSTGGRLKDFNKITLEVDVTPRSLYSRSSRKEEVVDYLKLRGFTLVNVETQSHGQEENLMFVLDLRDRT